MIKCNIYICLNERYSEYEYILQYQNFFQIKPLYFHYLHLLRVWNDMYDFQYLFSGTT